jgi:vancomycin aglycone glucosyltransferase
VRVLLSTYDSRGGVEPLVALAVRLQALGAEALVCAPPDCAERLAEVGVPLVPVGEPVRPLVHGATPPSEADVPRRITELIAAWFDKVAAAAEGCDALVASGLMPAAAGARSVAEKLGIHSVHVSYCPIFLPSPHRVIAVAVQVPQHPVVGHVRWEPGGQGRVRRQPRMVAENVVADVVHRPSPCPPRSKRP